MDMSVLTTLRGQYVDLSQRRLGTEVVDATDDFFGDKSRLIDPDPPVFLPGKYDDHGKWMDGWESRRKRGPGHDWCVIKLGVAGRVAGFEIDTRHFTGNYPPGAEIEVCRSSAVNPTDGWVKVTPRLELKGDDRVYVPIEWEEPVTHVRLHIFPDGGVARLRIWGHVDPDWAALKPDQMIDLLAMEWGGRAILANDEHFGRPENLTAPGSGLNMGDGWETRRRREPGNDWAILELGAAGEIAEIVVDTAHFKGNYPDRCSIQASQMVPGTPDELARQSEQWPILLAESRLQANHTHVFTEIAKLGAIRLVRFNIYPDGGVSRLRLRGTKSTVGRDG